MQTASNTPKNKKLNINKKLVILSLCIAGLTVVLAIMLGYTLLKSNSSLEFIAQKVVPASVVAEKISATSVQLNSEVPDVLNAKNQAELSAKYNNLLEYIDKQAVFLKELKSIPHNDSLSKELLDLIEQATAKLVIVNDYMSNILWTKDLEAKFSIKLTDTSNKFMLQITKLADDALFDLVANSKAVESAQSSTGANKEANQNPNGTGDKISKQLTVFNALLETKADGILIIGILETLLNHMNIDEIVPLQERFESATIKLKDHINVLTDSDANKYKDLNLTTNELIMFGQGKENCFSTRDAELRFASKISAVAKDLKPIGNKMQELEEQLLIDTLKNLDKLSSFKTQYNHLGLLLVFIFVFFTLVLGTCFYWIFQTKLKN